MSAPCAARSQMHWKGRFTTGYITRQFFRVRIAQHLVEPTPADHFTDQERRRRLVPDPILTSMPLATLGRCAASCPSPPAATAV